MEVVSIGTLVAVVGLAWKLSTDMGNMRADIAVIKLEITHIKEDNKDSKRR